MMINGYFIGFAGTSNREESAKYVLLAETIGEEIVRRGHRLVSGGCSGGTTQLCAEKAAKCLSDIKRDQEIDFRIISILPDDKFEEKHTTITLGSKFVCQGLTRNERRPFMASFMDVLITIAGGGGTGAEISACLKVGTPIIPIWHTGGSSLEYWNRYIKPMLDDDSDKYYKGITIKKLEDLEKVDLLSQDRMGRLAVDIAIELAKKKHKYRCTAVRPSSKNIAFIVMPFDQKFDNVFLAIKDIFEKGIYSLPLKFDCIRHDQVLSGKIDSSLSQYIAEATLLIVDVTGNNPNVVYEHGIGIGLGKKQILISQSPTKASANIFNEIKIKYHPSRLNKLQEKLVKAIGNLFKMP